MRVVVDSSLLRNGHKRILFVDLGANVGQSYAWFSRFYGDLPGIQFELFEPNPNCVAKLERLPDVASGKVFLHKVGVGGGGGTGPVPFYGLSEEEGGIYSLGGSIVPEHNAPISEAPRVPSESVMLVRLSEYLSERATLFDRIVCKMDIEGAELDVLEDLVDTGTIDLLDILYVEFHSTLQPNSVEAKRREDCLIDNIRARKRPALRLWF